MNKSNQSRNWGVRALSKLAFGGLASVAVATAFAEVMVGTGLPSRSTIGQTTASSLRVDSGGTGHGLIVPYFTTQNGAVMSLNVVNTDLANGKVVKVRLRGAGNGDALLSMTVLVAAGDMWAASMDFRDGAPQLFVGDNSCTLPSSDRSISRRSSQALLTDRLAFSYSAEQKIEQAREGTLEFITMADVPAAKIYGSDGQSNSALFTAMKHVNGVPPCGAVADRLLQDFSTESDAAAFGLAAPTGGLSGRWIIINGPSALTFTGAMHTVRAVDHNGADARANFVLFPQTDAYYPIERVDGVTADPLLRTQAYPGKNANGAPSQQATTAPALRALHADFPDFSTPYTVAPGQNAALEQATQFTRAMAVTSAQNEHLMEPAVEFKTDWVLSLPARRFSVAVDHTTAEPRLLYSTVPITGNQFFHDANMHLSATDRNIACVSLPQQPDVLDRDGKPSVRSITFSPFDRQFRHTCGAVSVLSFAPEVTAAVAPTMSSVLGAKVTRPAHGGLVSNVVEGWTTLDFFTAPTGLGLPVIAHAFSSAFNPAARAGVSGNYGMNSEHVYTR
jgi:hypothetical protein